MLKKTIKLSSYLLLGSSLVSCSGASVKKSKSTAQKFVQKKAVELEIASLWLKVEYSRLVGDETQAVAHERDLEILESELDVLIQETNSDTSLTSR